MPVESRQHQGSKMNWSDSLKMVSFTAKTEIKIVATIRVIMQTVRLPDKCGRPPPKTPSTTEQSSAAFAVHKWLQVY